MSWLVGGDLCKNATQMTEDQQAQPNSFHASGLVWFSQRPALASACNEESLSLRDVLACSCQRMRFCVYILDVVS